MRRVVLLFLLLTTGAFSADFVTIRNGNWHNNVTTKTPWGTGACGSATETLAIPGSGDRVTLCNALTLHCESGQTCAIGDSPANDSATPALQSVSATGTGVLALDTGSTFIFKGPIRQSNAIWMVAAGSTLTHDSSGVPGTPKYTWRIGQTSLTTGLLRLTGSSGQRIAIGTASGSGDFGGFTSSFTNAGQIVAAYTDFSHCGTAAVTPCISVSLDGTTGSPSFSLDHSTVDATSGGVLLSNVSGNAVVSLTNSSVRGRDSNSRAVSLGTGTIAPLTTGTRLFQGNYTTWTIYVGMDMIVKDNFGFVSSSAVTNVEGKATAGAASFTPGNWQNNVFWLDTGVSNNQASHLPGGTLQRTYFLESSTVACSTNQNYHWVYMASVDSMLDSWIFEPDCGTSQSNVIQNIATNVGAFSHEVKNSIALPGSNGGGPNLYDYDATGTCDQSGLWCPIVSVHHNTVVGTDGTAECGVAGGEGSNWIAGAYSQIANNILWQPSPGGGCIAGWGPPLSADPPVGTFRGTDYNWRWNINGGSLYRHLPAYSNPSAPGSHDISGDPQFVDSARNFLSWCKSLNPADRSWADCQAHFADVATGSHDPRYSPAALIEYVRSGFRPQNPASFTASSEGNFVGAVPPLPGSNDPTVFYTDLDSGPVTGGEHDKGAYVTIYGNNFGSIRGDSKVTFGGGNVASYVSWTNTKIVVQIGPFANTGAVVVTVGGAVSNTDVAFTVRPGNIYFVKTTGNDADDGDFVDPWRTLVQCRKSLAPGDICYVMDGVSQTAQDNFNTALSIMSSGTAGRPKAIVAYPGAQVTVGGITQFGLRPPAITGAPFEYWTIAGLHIAGGVAGTAIAVAGRGWRVVGNEMTCPAGNGASACVEGSNALHSRFLGNEVHNAGCGEVSTPCAWTNTNTTISSIGTALSLSGFQSGLSVPDRILVAGQQRRLVSCSDTVTCTLDSPFSPDLPTGTSWQYRDYMAVKLYHSVYYSTDSSDVEIGWNYIHDNHSCRGIQFHSSPTVTALALASASNTSPIVITYNSTILYQGTRVFITGVSGNSGALGAFFLDPINATSARLWLDKGLTVPSVGTGAGTGGTLANGLNQYDLSVHDNIVTGQACDGINLATVDASIGFAMVYNNIVYNTGAGGVDGIATGLDTAVGPANYTGFYNPATTNTGPPGSGTIQVFNNTFYNNGTGGTSGRGAWGSMSGGPSVNFTNNIFYQPAGAGPYVEAGSGPATYSGQNNLWYGKGVPPAGFTANVNADPAFSIPGANFHLLPNSPAIAAGVYFPVAAYDPDGLVRPFPPAVGAFDTGTSFLNGTIMLQASPTSLSFNYTLDGLAPAAQTVNVSSTGGLSIDDWTAISAQPWLSLMPAAGVSAGAFQATIVHAGLTAGTLTGSISVASVTPRVVNSPRIVGVTLNVFPAPQIISTALPGAVIVGGSYSGTLAAVGGQPPYIWSANPSGLCSGLSLSSAGIISGSPTKAGKCNFTAVLREGGGAVASKSFSIPINTGAAPVKAAQTVRSGTVNH